MASSTKLPDYIPLNEHDDDQCQIKFDEEEVNRIIDSVIQASSTGAWSNGDELNSNGHNDPMPKENLREEAIKASISRRPSSPSQHASPPPLSSPPQFIIFGISEDDLSFIISKKGLANLPDLALRYLASKGNMSGPSLCMTNYDQLESMKRLKDYLESKTYEPFKSKTPLTLILADGTTKAWDPPSKPVITPRIAHVEDTTRDLYNQEIDLYLFAKEIKFEELRQASMEKLMYGYPKGIDGIWRLVEELFLKTHRADRVLRQHIMDLIHANRRELVARKPYAQLMRRYVKTDSVLGEALLSALIKAAEQSEGHQTDSPRRTDSLRDHTAHRNKTNVDAPKDAPKEPASQLSRTMSSTSLRESGTDSSEVEWPADQVRPSDLPKLSEALLNNRLGVARKSGYGTIVRPGAGRERNKGFQFSAGEIMLIKGYESSSKHNIIVFNSKGEKGDVLGDMFSEIPITLGIAPADREWGQIYQPLIPMRSDLYPDREDRSHGSKRKRSVSPSRRSVKHEY